MRELRAGSNYVSQDPAEAHFGLGAGTVAARVRVVWPDGDLTDLHDVPASAGLPLVIDEPGLPPTPTGTSTAEPIFTPTPSATNTAAAATASPTATAACMGDCDANGSVGVNELVRLVGIALGTITSTACPALDLPAPGIDDLVRAVRNALSGCG